MIDSNKTLCCTINNEFRDLEEVIIQYPSCALFLWGGGTGWMGAFSFMGRGNWGDGLFFRDWALINFSNLQGGRLQEVGHLIK